MERPRTRSRRIAHADGAAAHPIATPPGLAPNTGPLASAAWLVARGLLPEGPRWFVEIAFDADPAARPEAFDERTATRFQIEIYAEEWGYRFCHDGQVSWVRVTDIPFVHVRDDFELVGETRPLKHIGRTIAALERRYAIGFVRDRALVRTSLADATETIHAWARSL